MSRTESVGDLQIRAETIDEFQVISTSVLGFLELYRYVNILMALQKSSQMGYI